MPNFARYCRIISIAIIAVSLGWFVGHVSSTSDGADGNFAVWTVFLLFGLVMFAGTKLMPEEQFNYSLGEGLLARRGLAMIIGWAMILLAIGLLLMVVFLDPLDNPHDLIKFMIGCPLLAIIAMVYMGAYDLMCDRIKRSLHASGN